MSPIRPLERGDLPGVASLYELRLGTGSRVARPTVAPFLERTLLDQPWADPELPSLVHVESDGRVTGFVASQVRRMRFDGERIRMVCVSHLVSDPEARRPIGALLLRRLFDGPQELSVTDTATEVVRAMWEQLGAETVFTSCIHWRRLLRPWAYAAGRLSERRGAAGSQPGAPLRLASRVLDVATASVAPGLVRARRPEATLEPLTPVMLPELVESVGRNLRLVPDWDREFADWLFAEIGRRPGGELAGRKVTRNGQTVGWFVYQVDRSATCQLMEAAAATGREDIVLDHLFHEAEAVGATAIEGRVEPRFLEPLSRRQCIFRYGVAMMARSLNPDILHSIESGRALLSRLEGEWVGIV